MVGREGRAESGSRYGVGPFWGCRTESERRWLWVVLGMAALAVAGLVGWAVWPSPPAAPRARPYLAFTACLLTDGQAVAGSAAGPVWAGMQDASLAARAKVQYLPAVGAVDAAEVLPYLASLVQRQCDLIVAVGAAQVAAVDAAAERYPGTRFVAVGGTRSRQNVTVVDGSSTPKVRERISSLIRAAVRS
jgi:basic membrane lipoprotein Med (substrate-binding protein (PBP1-ABC) superfamily)